MKSFYMILVAVLLAACGPSIKVNIKDSASALEKNSRIRILYLHRDVPPNVKEIGSLDFGDTGFSTTCNYAKFTESATEEARRVGSNIVKIVKHDPVSFWSSCDEIKATFYRQ